MVEISRLQEIFTEKVLQQVRKTRPVLSSSLKRNIRRTRGAAFFFFTFYFFFPIFKFLLLFNYSCLHFLPISPPHPSQTHLPPCFHPPPWFCPCVLYSSSSNPLSPRCPPLSPLAIVRLFLTTMSLVIFCLLFSFVDYVPVKGEIIWYLSLTAWLISLSIMLSSSIHAIAKGISSFFLSAA